MEGRQRQRQGHSSYTGSLGRTVHWAKRKTGERGEILTEGYGSVGVVGLGLGHGDGDGCCVSCIVEDPSDGGR
jgi:hypothetical protein